MTNSYIGVPPKSGFINTAKQRVTSSTNNYVDLDHSISSLADVIVWVNSVKQDSTNLTLTTSTRITLGGTLVSSDVCEISFLGKAVATQTPDTGTVTNDMLAGSIANSKLANSSITLNGSAVSLGGSATISSAAGTGLFRVRKDSLTIANSTDVAITGYTEEFDVDNLFANNKYTVAVTGTYFFHYSIRNNNSGTSARFKIALKQNGTELQRSNGETNTVSNGYMNAQMTMMVGANANDYFELVTFQNSGDSNFSAFDIIFQGFRIA